MLPKDLVTHKIRGICWRCAPGGHHGNAEPEILKKVCKAFNHTCTKCGRIGHFAKRCKPRGPASPMLPTDLVTHKIRGVCWRCAQEGHRGNAEPKILKQVCQAFNNKCTKCKKKSLYQPM